MGVQFSLPGSGFAKSLSRAFWGGIKPLALITVLSLVCAADLLEHEPPNPGIFRAGAADKANRTAAFKSCLQLRSKS